MLRVKVGGILKIRAYNEVIVELCHAFWECPSPIGFTHWKTWTDGYHEPEHT
jgi:hypothetical protein